MHHGLTEPKNARVLYVDMNAFYASIEQQYHPELRDIPVAVASHLTGSGTVLASSYEAKALGIVTGMKLREAKDRYPNLAIVETDHVRYRSVHVRLNNLLIDLFGPLAVQMRSVDEAAITLPPSQQDSLHAHFLAAQVKEMVREKLGVAIRCSIGIAPNSLLAKLATDLQKPNGLVEITLESTPALLETLPLTALPGIAHANAGHLALNGITNPREFYDIPADTLRRIFGIWGQYWWWRLHGYEADGNQNAQRTISHEHVLTHWLYRRSEGEAILSTMAERLIHRLRRNGFSCQSLSVSVSSKGYPRSVQEHHFDAPTASYPLLLQSFHTLYRNLPESFSAPVRKFSLTLYGLSEQQGIQTDLFSDAKRDEAVSELVEQVRTRHGFGAIQNALSLQTKLESLKEQPGFGKIRDKRNY